MMSSTVAPFKFLQEFPVLMELLDTKGDFDDFDTGRPPKLETLLPKFVHRTTDGLNVVHLAVKVMNDTDKFRAFLKECTRLCFAFQQEALLPQMLQETDIKCGNTPLLLATYLGKFEFVEVLVEHGARKDVKNKYGESYMDIRNYFTKKNRLAFIDIELRFLPSELRRMYRSLKLTEEQFKQAMEKNILEIAVIVYDPDRPEEAVAKLNVVQHMDSDEVADEEEKKSMSSFSYAHFQKNGLLQQCRSPPGSIADGVEVVSLQDMELTVLKFLKEHFVKKLCKPVGFSVHQDVDALRETFPGIHEFLHYQIIDLTSIMGLAKAYPNSKMSQVINEMAPFQQKDWYSTTSHRAMYDAEAALAVFQSLASP